MVASLRVMPFLMSMAFLFVHSVAFAATINVTTTDDEFDYYNEVGNGQCSLREAVLAANDNISVHGDCTAGESGVVDTIVIPAGTYMLTRTCGGYDELSTDLLFFGGVECGDLDIEEDVVIQGAGKELTIITVAPEYIMDEVAANYLYEEDYRAFDIDDYQDELLEKVATCDDECELNLEVTFMNMTISGGSASDGGAIRLNSAPYYDCGYNSLVVDGVKATENTAYDRGGAIAAYGQLTMTDSEITQNLAGSDDMYYYGYGQGGGVAVLGPESLCAGQFTSTITNSTVSENTASRGYGGGVFNVYMSNLDILNTVIDDNKASYAGGGIYNELADLNVTGGSVSGNSGYEYLLTCGYGNDLCVTEDDEYVPGVIAGGGIYNSVQDFTLRARDHSDIAFLTSDVTVSGTEIMNNIAMYAGGGIMNATPEFFCDDSSVASDISADICVGQAADEEPQPDEPIVIPNSTFVLTGSTVSGNTVQSPYESSGAGVYNSYYTGEFSIIETTISDNTGGYAGGGVFNDWAMTIDKSTINNNATALPMTKLMERPLVQAEDVPEVYVTSFGGGGGVANSGSLVMTNSTVSGNETYGIGAGVGNNLSERYYYFYQMTNQEEDPSASPSPTGVIDDDDDDYDNYVMEPLPLPGTDLRNVTVTANTVLALPQDEQENINPTMYYGSVYASNGGGISTRYGTIRVRNTIVAGNFDEADNYSDFGPYVAGDVVVEASPTPEMDPVDMVPAYAPDCWVEPKQSLCMMEEGECEDYLPKIISEQHNIIGDNTGCVPFESVSNENQDKIGTEESPIDPLLGPLADNGGPTATHALLADSPAIDMGNSTGEIAAAAVDASFACETDDQRSQPRPIDGDLDGTATCDIGAYEVQFDCAGVDGGSAVEDECGVCGGDGSSCAPPDEVQCEEVDITETQFALDGSADEQLNLAKRLRRKLKRKTGKRNAGSKLLSLVSDLRNANWNFAWSIPSVIQTNCTGATTSCVEVSNQDALGEYISNANEMYDAIKKLIRKLRKEGLGKKQRRKFVKRNATILDSALLSTEAVPASTTVCE